MAGLLWFDFEMEGPKGVRIRYTELICNKFKIVGLLTDHPTNHKAGIYEIVAINPDT